MASERVKMRSEPAKKKQRTKNAPDKPQPEWMFPPDEENPALNPKPVSEEQKRKAQEEWKASMKYLNYKSVTAPMKPPPPALLLTLVGGFLTSYGLNSTSRLYTTEVAARAKLDAWKPELGVKLPKGFPDLVKIYKDWHKEYQQRTELDQTSSDEDENEDATKVQAKNIKEKQKEALKAKVEADATSSSGDSSGSSSDDSGSDVKMRDVAPTPKSANKQASTTKPSKKTNSTKFSSTSSTSSDSDADDEKEAAGTKLLAAETIASNPINKLKRKASSSGSSSSDSGSGSDSLSDEVKAPPAKRTKAIPARKQSASVAAPAPSKSLKKSATSSSSSSESSTPSGSDYKSAANIALPASSSDSNSSSSDSDAPVTVKPSKSTTTKSTKPQTAKLIDGSHKSSTDSSATLEDPVIKKTSISNTSTSVTSSSSASPPPEEDALEAPKLAAKKRKHSASPQISAVAPTELETPKALSSTKKPTKKQPKERFSRIPADVKVDPRMASNAYIPNDYADRAFRDLSVTKGKGFTKEKNKKKRGSYRGGTIDVEGRKGIKFD